MQTSIALVFKTKMQAKLMHVMDVQTKASALQERLAKKTQVSYLSKSIPSLTFECFRQILVVEEVRQKLAGVKNVVLVLSGKGGVGKSTVST